MASDEDYLDNLLNSISQKRSDVKKEAAVERQKAAEKFASENDIKPEDDFLKASGLDGYTEKPIERKNLKKAFSENDFLKEFESELAEDNSVNFANEFDNEFDEDSSNPSDNASDLNVAEGSRNIKFSKDRSEFDDIQDTVPDDSGDDFIYNDLPDTKTASHDADGNESFADGSENSAGTADVAHSHDSKAEDDVLSNIDNIVKNAKNNDLSDIHDIRPSDEIQKDLLSDTPEIDNSESEKNGDISDSSEVENSEKENNDDLADFSDIELPADFDLNDTSAKEVDLMDENLDMSNQNLDDLLDGSNEFGDLGNILSADQNSEELSEARDQFEQSAEALEKAAEDPFADLQNDDAAISDLEGKDSKKKGSFFSGFFSKLKNIFSKSDDEASESPDASKSEDNSGVVDIAPKNPTTDELLQEDQKILNEFSDSEPDISALDGAADASSKDEKEKPKKKEKKKKEKKEKPKKQPKPKKVRAPKPPDNSPKIPAAAIVVNGILALSIVLLVVILSNAISHKNMLADAKADFDSGNYHEAYVTFSGIKLKESDEPYLRKSKIMSSLSISYEEYKTCMEAEKYDMALDALVKGVHYYNVNKPAATELEIDDIYDNMENTIVSELSDKFGVSADDAENLYAMKSRVLYTVAINDILTAKGYTGGETQ